MLVAHAPLSLPTALNPHRYENGRDDQPEQSLNEEKQESGDTQPCDNFPYSLAAGRIAPGALVGG